MKKLIAFGYIVLSLIAVTGCSNPASSNISDPAVPSSTSITKRADQTASWLTYANAKWGFEIKYPDTHKVTTDQERTGELALSFREIDDPEEAKNVDGVCTNCSLRVQVLRNFIGGTEKGSFKTPEEWIDFQNKLDSKYTPTTLAGQRAYTLTNEQTGRKTYLIYKKNGTMYDRYDFSLKTNDQNADAMLSTLLLSVKESSSGLSQLVLWGYGFSGH